MFKLFIRNVLAGSVQFSLTQQPQKCLHQLMSTKIHDYIVKMKRFAYYWAFMRDIYGSPVNSIHKGPVMLKTFLSQVRLTYTGLTGCRYFTSPFWFGSICGREFPNVNRIRRSSIFLHISLHHFQLQLTWLFVWSLVQSSHLDWLVSYQFLTKLLLINVWAMM